MLGKLLFGGMLAAGILLSGCGAKQSPAPAADPHAGHAHAAGEAKVVKAQTTCPVMGGGINKSIYADHEGERVYFCCNACISTFKKSPEKYLKKLRDQGVTPAKVPSGT